MDLPSFCPHDYRPLVGIKETEHAIKELKDFFELNLATELNLSRVTAPLFVRAGTGVNDDLNGVELPVVFAVKAMPGVAAEIVQSLAKWKRLQLGELGFTPGYGLYTDMNAIRPHETLDQTHSLYVDQWDWERVITPAERTMAFLEKIVRKIFSILKRTEHFVCERHPAIRPVLPEGTVTFGSQTHPADGNCGTNTDKAGSRVLLAEVLGSIALSFDGTAEQRQRSEGIAA